MIDSVASRGWKVVPSLPLGTSLILLLLIDDQSVLQWALLVAHPSLVQGMQGPHHWCQSSSLWTVAGQSIAQQTCKGSQRLAPYWLSGAALDWLATRTHSSDLSCSYECTEGIRVRGDSSDQKCLAGTGIHSCSSSTQMSSIWTAHHPAASSQAPALGRYPRRSSLRMATPCKCTFWQLW